MGVAPLTCERHKQCIVALSDIIKGWFSIAAHVLLKGKPRIEIV